MIRKARLIFLLAVLSVLAITCKKNEINNPDTSQGTVIDLSIKVMATVSGFVTNESDAVVRGASVQYGTSNATTDTFGYFEIKDAIVSKNAAFVTVTNTGYFKGIKTFIVEEGKPNFCRIKLIPKTIAGSVNSTTGGNIATANGLSISLPSNSVIDAVTRTLYTGTVNASMFWIDPTAEDLGSIMPGDLRGINASNTANSLITYGMAAVELTGDAGQLLQVAEGKKANVNFPLPAAMVADAPVSIPLWYFDETNGLWKEEGTATKTGNNYTGDVSHFSYWNCDIPLPPSARVNFSCTLVDSSGNPYGGRNVEVVRDGYSNLYSAYGCTNPDGFISGVIPANSQLTLLVSEGAWHCSPIAYHFTTGSTTYNLGTVKMPVNNGISTTTVSGRVTDCNANPLTNGHVIVTRGNYSSYYQLNGGSFSVPLRIDNCLPNQFSIVGVNTVTNEKSAVHTYLLNNQNITLPDLSACWQSTFQYSSITIDGQSFILGPEPNGTVFSQGQILGLPNNNNYTYFQVSLLKLVNGTYIRNSDKIRWDASNNQFPPTINTPNYIRGFTFAMGIDSNYVELQLAPLNSTACPVNFTEYGLNAGEYISGSFDAILYKKVGNTIDINSSHHIVYQFRVLKI